MSMLLLFILPVASKLVLLVRRQFLIAPKFLDRFLMFVPDLLQSGQILLKVTHGVDSDRMLESYVGRDQTA